MIEIRNFTKQYGDFTAVDDITLEVSPGEIFGFLGPNGAGKTTTIRVLAGLSLPTRGSVRVNGFDVVTQSVQAKSSVGYVPDRPYLYEKLTATELLRFVADLYEKPWSECAPRAAELMRYFELAEWAGARIENLSHGMKQKLVIIAALVHDPDVLIIDEPMVGLDALAQRQVKLLFRRLAAEKKTVLLTTHTMTVAEAVCDRIAIIHRGKIIARGTTVELKAAAGQPGSPLRCLPRTDLRRGVGRGERGVSERLDALRSRLRQDALERGFNARDVDLLLADALGRSVSWLFAHGEEPVDEAIVRAQLDRRFAGEPVQYIRGSTEFYSRDFLVDDRVLIPRPETELLVEQVVQHAPLNARVIDVGTGSGCIAISVERERPDLSVVSVDLSLGALALAARNRILLDSRVRFFASDVLSSVRGTFDLVVSNPPYIASGAIEHLAVEVRGHEPRLALTPGPRGTEVIERLLDQSRALLAPNGLVMMEIGYAQESAVRELSAAHGYEIERVVPDLAGIPRIVVARARRAGE